MRETLLYGIEQGSKEQARSALEQALGIRFELGENLSFGVYFRLRNCGDRANLYENLNKEYASEGRVVRFPNVPDYIRVIFEVETTNRADEYERLLNGRIPGLVLLRRAYF